MPHSRQNDPDDQSPDDQLDYNPISGPVLPCFSDRFNLLLKLLLTPPHPVTGKQRPYRIAELSDALPLSDEGRRFSETRLRQFSRLRDSNPTLVAVRQIASGFATLAARSTDRPEDHDTLWDMYYRYLAGGAREMNPRGGDADSEVVRLHEQFTATLARRERESHAVSILGRYLDLETPQAQEDVLQALDTALRSEGQRGFWPRKRGK